MEVILRLCDENDIDKIYELANDPTVRENAFCSSLISYTDHYKWYTESLVNENRLMFIAEENNCIVGQIRLDKQENRAIISYSVIKNRRGKGYGKKILELIKKEVIRNDITILEGLVKKNNTASRKAFISNGFLELEKETYFKYIFTFKK